jgi:hypothetical protein
MFSPTQAVAGGAETVSLQDSAVGYIDSAIIRSQVRVRFDAAYGDNRPDRAEFFYPKCGCFRIVGLDPNASGPPPGGFNTATSAPASFHVDYQELSTYVELAANSWLSGFIEVPVRFLNPDVFEDFSGFGDLQVGFKAALINMPDRVVTFQGRIYTPTGAGDRGLGTDHVSLEPALLFYQRLTDKLQLEGEFRFWIPIGGSDFEGDVLRYGLGLSYLAYNRPKFRVLPVVEFVAWSVLNGKEFASPGVIQDAGGDFIMNAKFGVRLGFGDISEPGMQSGSEFYVGYGRALTGAVWYKDILRVEYRLFF